jgi:hypothetical protein
MPLGHIVISEYMYDHFSQEVKDIYDRFTQQGEDIKCVSKKKGREMILHISLNHPDFLPDEPDREYTLYIGRKRDKWGNFSPFLLSLRTRKGNMERIVKEYV